MKARGRSNQTSAVGAAAWIAKRAEDLVRMPYGAVSAAATLLLLPGCILCPRCERLPPPQYCCQPTPQVVQAPGRSAADWGTLFDDPVLTNWLTQIERSHPSLADATATYVRIRVKQSQIAIAKSHLDQQSETLALVNERHQTGRVTELDVAQAKSLRYRTIAAIAALEQELPSASLRLRSASVGLDPRKTLPDGPIPSPVLKPSDDRGSASAKFDGERRRSIVLQKAIAQDRRAVELGRQRYCAGKSSFQRILDAQRQLFDDEMELAAVQGAAALEAIGLYGATRGDWLFSPIAATAAVSAAPASSTAPDAKYQPTPDSEASEETTESTEDLPPKPTTPADEKTSGVKDSAAQVFGPQLRAAESLDLRTAPL